MRKNPWAAAALCALLLAGCLPLSLHPLYEADQVVFDEDLLGTWVRPEEPKEGRAREQWTFARSDKARAYDLLVRDADGQQGRFIVHLVALDGERFLDLYPKDPRKGAETVLYRLLRLPVHSFLRIRLAGGRLSLSAMNLEWLKKHLADHPDALRHEIVEDDFVVITAPPQDLQAFLREHARAEGAFGDPVELVREAQPPAVPQEGVPAAP